MIAKLIERFDIRGPNDARWVGYLYATTSRECGRQIRVFVKGDEKMWIYDTDECYDLGNATNALGTWIAQQFKAAGIPLVA